MTGEQLCQSETVIDAARGVRGAMISQGTRCAEHVLGSVTPPDNCPMVNGTRFTDGTDCPRFKELDRAVTEATEQMRNILDPNLG